MVTQKVNVILVSTDDSCTIYWFSKKDMKCPEALSVTADRVSVIFTEYKNKSKPVLNTTLYIFSDIHIF